jgi:hypothetical protein
VLSVLTVPPASVPVTSSPGAAVGTGPADSGAVPDAAACDDEAEERCNDDCEGSDRVLHGVSFVGTPWIVDVLRNRPLAAG